MSDPATLTSPSVATLETSLDTLSLSQPHRSTDASLDGSPIDYNSDSATCELYADQRDVIRKALDQQTQILYEQYAQEQHPKDAQKQKELVSDMQEQFFARYLVENHQSQLLHQRQQLQQLNELRKQVSDDTEKEAADYDPVCFPLIPATIWTRKEIADFKQEILKTQRECCIKIGSLATATIRVPTHPDGAAIFWEFATDHYDLGFGLYFEWDVDPPSSVTINISESSDEEDLDDQEEEEHRHNEASDSRSAGDATPADVERGGRNSGSNIPMDELIPVYRRDCHTEVYCGSHRYPGVGVYVFKFDNSFSLWRSKWLYYRIYYTQ